MIINKQSDFIQKGFKNYHIKKNPPQTSGWVAIKLNELLQHHFKEEENYVLPPLGLLPLLANEKLPENSNEVISLTEKLKSQLSHISAEHQMIKAFIQLF